MSALPAQLGPYTIDREIGRGGMGVVYLGHDTRLDRKVAIKALPEHFAEQPERLARFEREAKTLAQLNHPHVGGIYGVEEHEGARYLVLEYVDGETLSDRLDAGPLPVGEAVEICAQVAAGLQAAHEAGVIHRDLKPDNVRVTPEGVAKVLDFGLAHVDEGSGSFSSMSEAQTLASMHSPTATGAIVGTAGYMSPEQARGKKIDARTDIWSLALLLYECLTGLNPFKRETGGDSIAAILTIEPDFSRLPAHTPPLVREVLRRCLRKDPRERMRDAGDVRLLLADAGKADSEDESGLASSPVITEGRFRITDEIIRSLDRGGFDATLLGWEMRYADNNRESDVLIVWIPSIGGDHETPAWRELLSTTPHRVVAICPVGMEPGVENRPLVSIENQFTLIRALTGHLRASLRPKKTIITGFACGSIMALRCAAGDETGGLFDGVLTIDADMQERDCFVSRLFAGLDASRPDRVMDALRTMSASCQTVGEWVVLHEHMVDCVDKFKADLSPLVAQGRDLSAPFEGVDAGGDSPFIEFLRDAVDRVRTVRCVFHDSAENRRLIGDIRMSHLDSQCLGSKFRDESIVFIPISDHVGMMFNDRLLEYLDLIVEAVQ